VVVVVGTHVVLVIVDVGERKPVTVTEGKGGRTTVVVMPFVTTMEMEDWAAARGRRRVGVRRRIFVDRGAG
jgi:hypothetical protein